MRALNARQSLNARNTRDLLDIKHTGAEAARSAERQESAEAHVTNA